MRMSRNPPSSTVAAPPTRRWPRRLLIILLILVGLPAAYYFYARWALEADINRAIAETDALDGRWRLQDLEADREVHRDEANSALHVIKVKRMIGAKPIPGSQKDYDAVFKDLPASAQLNVQQLEMIRTPFEQYPDALAEARKLKDMPKGRFPMTLSPDFYATLLPNHQDGREIARLLMCDAMLRGHDGDPDGALESCTAILNIGRAYGDEPFVITLLLRMVCADVLVQAVERTLAQGFAKEASLKPLQQRLMQEGADLRVRFVEVVRGERAGRHQFFELLRQGELRLGEHMVTTLRMRITLPEQIASNLLPELYMKDYPGHLRHMNALVEAARLPLHEQLERFEALSEEVDRSNTRTAELAQILPLLPPSLTKACQAHLPAQANLAAAAAGVAGERFRLAHQRWPESLAELVHAGLLDAIPTDPFDGQALRFARLQDGLVIYSVGHDRRDNGGNIARDRPLEPGVDLGFRLWDAPQRRQPPRPLVALPR
jgi:hypothetical protein